MKKTLSECDLTYRLLKQIWMKERKKIKFLFPFFKIQSRLNSDIYHLDNGKIIRDAAGIRIIVNDFQELLNSLEIVKKNFTVTEIRNYLSGHVKYNYYRALHVYIMVDNFEIEVQIRTKRQNLIAQWTHCKMLNPQNPKDALFSKNDAVINSLNVVSKVFDQWDKNIYTCGAGEIPLLLKRDVGFGKVRTELRKIDDATFDFPFLSHSVKSFGYFQQIILEQSIKSAITLNNVRKFSDFSDSFFEKDKYVMFSLGHGYIVDNKNMKVSFLYDAKIIKQKSAITHLKPIVYEACLIILKVVKECQRERWLKCLADNNYEFARYNNAYCITSFKEYLTHFFTSSKPKLDYKDTWGPSTFSKGIINLLYLNNDKLKAIIDHKIEGFKQGYLKQGADGYDYINAKWLNLNLYYSLKQKSMRNDVKNHTHVLIKNYLHVWDDTFLGIAVAHGEMEMFKKSLAKVCNNIPHNIIENAKIFCANKAFELKHFIK